jgi:ferric-dicitrate binding protein FerR (iron transport regulator)
MNQYKEYSLEDFVLDARFQDWVRYKRSPDNLIWQKYQLENSHQSHDIRQARALLESVYRHYEADIHESEIDFEIQELLTKVRSEKEVSLEGSNVRIAGWKRPFFGRISAYQAAAVIAVGLGLAFLINHYNFRETAYQSLVSGKQLEEIRNDSDEDKVVLLTDGSKVTLQPNSMLSFPENFMADKREVYLSGEAFFQVSKDSKRPFFVYANELVTKVLGTSFMINAADAAHKTTVEVREGKVSVFKQDDFKRADLRKALPLKGLVLTANQKVVFETENSDMLKTLSDKPEIVVQDESPKTFDFVNTPASSVLADLKSAYQIDIIFDKELLAECPVTASLNRQSLFEKLNIICEVIEARYEIIDGQIVVYSRGCKS